MTYLIQEDPVLFAQIAHFSTAKENSITKKNQFLNLSFLPQSNELLVMSNLQLFLIEISLRKSEHFRY
jgi:hypothetical protein